MTSRPFLVSLRDLRRTQGARKEFNFDAGFDSDLVTGLATAPAGRLVQVTGVAESVGDGIWVTGQASTTLDVQCSRCLTPFSSQASVSFQELFIYPERESDYGTTEAGRIEDDAVDLEDVVRDMVILDQSTISLCREDCAGLCPRCGVDLNAQPDHDHGDEIDSRWLGLAQWGKMP